jgi:hypothetical protein
MTAAGRARPLHELAPKDEDHRALAFTTLRQLVDSCKTFEEEVVRGCVCKEDVFERVTQFDKSLEQAVELASASGSGSAPSQTNSDMSCDGQDGDPDDENVIKRYFTSTKIFGDSLKSRSLMFWPPGCSCREGRVMA